MLHTSSGINADIATTALPTASKIAVALLAFMSIGPLVTGLDL